jgi:hypothetical protein
MTVRCRDFDEVRADESETSCTEYSQVVSPWLQRFSKYHTAAIRNEQS